MFSKPFPMKPLIIIVFSLLIFDCKKENIIYPQPTFQLIRSSYYQGETVQLNADFPVAGEVYTWDFGDGTSAQGSSVTHKYNAGGMYYIILSNQSTGLPSTGLVSTENG